MMPDKNSNIVIWDYDGTLVDTRRKNLNVTRQIVEMISSNDWKNYPAIATPEAYSNANKTSVNWRDFYAREFSFSEEQIDRGGKTWTEFQLRDSTPTPLIAGIEEVVRRLGFARQGIVSQNSGDTIRRVLKENGILECFQFIVGYEEVDIRRQKPEPDGLLLCIEKLHCPNASSVFYIGDHETDARCALNANVSLMASGSQIRVASIAAHYGDHDDSSGWAMKPDHDATLVDDILRIVNVELNKFT